MSEASSNIIDRSRKNERVVLNALAELGQANIADAINMSESTVSRLKDGQITVLASVLAACDLKIVPAKYKCLDPDKAQAMVTLYEAAMERIPNAVELLWGEE